MNKDYLNVIDAVNRSCNKGVNSTFSCKGDYTMPMETKICFGGFTKYFSGSKTVDITVRLFREPIDKQTPDGRYSSSYGVTPFTNEEIIQYLNDLRKIFPFEFEIEEHEILDSYSRCRVFPEEGSVKRMAIDITYHISGPHIAFMFILSLQRFLYAHFDDYALALAFEIKNGNYGFDKMNLFNILNCTLSTISKEYRGGDMFHFDPSKFMYLYNSNDLREMLLAREKDAVEKGGCADLFRSMLYVEDANLEKFTIEGWPSFPGFYNQKYSLETIINAIIKNLTVLRKYNGFTAAGERRRKLMRDNYTVREGDINYYDERDDSIVVETKIDEQFLTKK